MWRRAGKAVRLQRSDTCLKRQSDSMDSAVPVHTRLSAAYGLRARGGNSLRFVTLYVLVPSERKHVLDAKPWCSVGLVHGCVASPQNKFFQQGRFLLTQGRTLAEEIQHDHSLLARSSGDELGVVPRSRQLFLILPERGTTPKGLVFWHVECQKGKTNRTSPPQEQEDHPQPQEDKFLWMSSSRLPSKRRSSESPIHKKTIPSARTKPSPDSLAPIHKKILRTASPQRPPPDPLRKNPSLLLLTNLSLRS